MVSDCPTCGALFVRIVDRRLVLLRGERNQVTVVDPPGPIGQVLCRNGHWWTIESMVRERNMPDRYELAPQ